MARLAPDGSQPDLFAVRAQAISEQGSGLQRSARLKAALIAAFIVVAGSVCSAGKPPVLAHRIWCVPPPVIPWP